MVRQSALIQKLNEYWRKRLQHEGDMVERVLHLGLLPVECDRSPVELVAACSLLIATKPIHEVLQSIDRYLNECDSPGFDEVFFQELQSTLRDLELAGLESHARKLRKVGQAMAGIYGAKNWQKHWFREGRRKIESAIKDEPFYPQQG